MSKEDSVPFKVALTMAKKSNYFPYKVGACLAHGRRVISGGYNQTKTHPWTQKLDNHFITGLHAEMHACIGVPKKSLIGAAIYVVRLRRDGTMGMARPCIECQKILRNFGVKRAYFTNASGRISSLKLEKK